MNVSSVIDFLKMEVEKDEGKGLKFIKSPYVFEFKNDKHDIFFYDDAIVYKEKKGNLCKVIPLQASLIEVLR